jgi:hypothetical protein
MDDRDLAHEADLRARHREQLALDCGDEPIELYESEPVDGYEPWPIEAYEF